MSKNFPFTNKELFEKIKSDLPELAEQLKNDGSKYLVLTSNRDGFITNVYFGKNESKATSSCNFWDARQNTYFIEPGDFAQAESDRINSMTLDDKLDEFHKEALARFSKKVSESMF